jgi:tRNA U34 5-methylaminomethyl-2-thiouridine-forming methyltransferase MnmC
MFFVKRELSITEDGSHTIYLPELNEHYHSIHGAVQESSLVFIKNGLDFCKEDPVKIFEVGFGTGLNALLSCLNGITNRRKIDFTSIEKYPLDERTIMSLNHHEFAGTNGKEIFSRIFNARWGRKEVINDYFSIEKIESDLTKGIPEGKYHVIFFDAFGPEKQPEMWTPAVFERISSITLPGGIFVTYSAKGDVKRALRSQGFIVQLLPGPPGKRQMIRAIKM